MKEKHIFIVEDEVHTQLALNVILRSAGYKVTTSSSCSEALDLLTDREHTLKPDLLVTDVYTPEMTGIDLLSELGKKHITLPTLIITGFRGKELISQLEDKGCRHFLFKPFSDDEFLEKTEQAMG